ncbi:MAG: hypothetical protein KF774_11265, partial [Planctomyces sp.]|nr:hypothetical protein [Planctomyces sp.]
MDTGDAGSRRPVATSLTALLACIALAAVVGISLSHLPDPDASREFFLDVSLELGLGDWYACAIVADGSAVMPARFRKRPQWGIMDSIVQPVSMVHPIREAQHREPRTVMLPRDTQVIVLGWRRAHNLETPE